MRWPLAANLSMLFSELPLHERPAAACAAGFAGVEIQFPYELAASQLERELARLALPLVLINVPAGDLMQGGAGLAAVPERRAGFQAALEQAVAYAERARPQRVNVLPGRLADGVEREAALACLADNLRLAADRFAGLGVGVCCEAINRLDMPGFLVSSSAELDDLLARVDHSNLSAQLDLYHMVRMGEALPESIGRLAGRIGHVQFADAPGRGAPGSGSLDFVDAMQALDEANYRGWLAAEYCPGVNDTLAWLADWRAAGWVG
ncbi:TIM barrel protein [Halopseudomonas oceani]|uniref:hydroxypyruvate isomerase family protein n=1 Tax=Halopseudomonas oceani TaxID=1708783 RepID=UPI002AA7D9A1|nr:TIM barrel protein [Halopseudomonas oceani]